LRGVLSKADLPATEKRGQQDTVGGQVHTRILPQPRGHTR
jgi:hypothetical protein